MTRKRKPGAGRKPHFPGMETTMYRRLIPKELVEELDNILRVKRIKYRKKVLVNRKDSNYSADT